MQCLEGDLGISRLAKESGNPVLKGMKTKRKKRTTTVSFRETGGGV